MVQAVLLRLVQAVLLHVVQAVLLRVVQAVLLRVVQAVLQIRSSRSKMNGNTVMSRCVYIVDSLNGSRALISG